MKVSKVLLYCTKAMPCLKDCKDYDSQRFQLDYEKKYCNKEECESAGANILNGSVCFECDCKEAFCLTMPDITIYYEEYISVNRKPKDPISHDELLIRSRLSNEQLNGYGKGKDLYAYHLENIKTISPFPITQLYKDEACTIPLTRAPQSYCFAYRRHDCTNEEVQMINYDYGTDKWRDENGNERFYDNRCFYYIEKVLVFSIRSPWLCKIANSEKDLEVRKTRIAKAGIEYK